MRKQRGITLMGTIITLSILGFLGIVRMMRAARTRARLKAPSLTEG